MKLGLMLPRKMDGRQGDSTRRMIADAQRAEADGFDSVWCANALSTDALTTLACIGQVTERIELGTSVVPTPNRHPTVMAQQALTVWEASNGRLALGIGLSHKILVEDAWGLRYDAPARQTEEYLNVLMPLLKTAQADFSGSWYRVKCQYMLAGAESLPVVVAALGPRMLAVAGRLADGTNLWMSGLKTTRDYIVPTIQAAAADADRPPPRIVSNLPVVVTNDTKAARAALERPLSVYGWLPSYAGLLKREGTADPVDLVLMGDKGAVVEQICAYKEAGVTDFNAWIPDTLGKEVEEATWACLAELTSQLKP